MAAGPGPTRPRQVRYFSEPDPPESHDPPERCKLCEAHCRGDGAPNPARHTAKLCPRRTCGKCGELLAAEHPLPHVCHIGICVACGRWGHPAKKCPAAAFQWPRDNLELTQECTCVSCGARGHPDCSRGGA
eukprot:RCo031484